MTEGQSRRSGGSETVWTPANIVTLLRICLVPLFVVAILSPWPTWLLNMPELESWKSGIAAIIFVALAATDGVDGYLARSRNEVTTFGKLIDPLADKILVAAALLVLVELRVLPSWPALIILAREFIVSGIRMIAASEGVVIAASWYGKAKTVTQIVAITLFLVKDLLGSTFESGPLNPLYILAWVVMIAALVLTILSMLDYFSKARHLLGFARSKSADGPSSSDRDPDEARAEDVLEAARNAGVRLATAESLTGGMIAAALTSVPGSSDVVAGGVVSYAVDAKERLLAVEPDDVERAGVVSEEVACEMAAGARKALAADVAVAVTGIAGPGGAEPGKPVGTVWLAIASERGAHAERFAFEGDRDAVRHQTVAAALEALLGEIRSLGAASA